MKILLDECVTKHLKPFLKDHEVYTVREMQWSGIQNGKLMLLCIENQFEILLTIDKNLQFQQNLERYPSTIVILNSLTSKVEELKLFIPNLLKKINNLDKHIAYVFERNGN
ncbi:MAG TPA: DUF5615 family PIN-like protein [Saprospiraceae bacterium]|nr:DUF5615 family PIN-like protein [Saprospiraceae bacterium]